MISQRCPKCLSKRVRRGYRPTPLWSKILFRYHLLCDSCNWEFVGFAVPGTVTSKPTKSSRKKNHSGRQQPEAVNLQVVGQNGDAPAEVVEVSTEKADTDGI